MTSTDPTQSAAAKEVVLVSSLLASRLCHDLVNPIGALNTGLEVLETEDDREMREHAMGLVKESAAKTISLLTFCRIAFGASGEWEGTIDSGEAGQLSQGLYAHAKAELDWQVAPAALPKPVARVLMNLVLVAERCVPRAGSTVTAALDGDAVTVTAAGPKAKLSPELSAALSGDRESLDAKASPAYLAALLARVTGGEVSAEAGEDRVVFRARVPQG